jgi:nicotinate phosphoribosyltransferase
MKDNIICDKYFIKTKDIINKFGDKKVIYGVFIRRPAIYAVKFAIDFLNEIAKKNKFEIKIHENFKEGDKTGAGEVLFFVEGMFSDLVIIETELLQKVGFSCICAYNAYVMTTSLSYCNFIAMEARHCIDSKMAEMAEYGASVGSKIAQKNNAKGFIGTSIEQFSQFFNNNTLGTMPHSLIGYAGSTIEAVKMFYETNKNDNITILVDYFGKEITDSIEVLNYLKNKIDIKKISIRIDTHGGRYLEGLNKEISYQIIDKYCGQAYYKYNDRDELNYLVGTGVSVAAIFFMRENLDKNGFKDVDIVASSGFNIKKCMIMGELKAPINTVGTGSFLPEKWTDTYTTADILMYDDVISVKQGREFLLKKLKNWKNI